MNQKAKNYIKSNTLDLEADSRMDSTGYVKYAVSASKAYAAIEIAEQDMRKWTSIEERLPDINNWHSENVLLKVIVNNKKGNPYECSIEAYYDSYIGGWHPMLPIDFKELGITPIAWRPL